MNKEEILQASRNENKNKDIFELEVTGKGQRIGGLRIYKAIKLKKPHETLPAVLWSFMMIYSAVMIVLQYIG